MAVGINKAPLELRTLLTELSSVRNWSGLANELGAPEDVKRTIEQQYSTNQQRLKEVFDWWMKRDHDVTWERITVALGRLHYYNLRDHILKKYCSYVDRQTLDRQTLDRPNSLEEVPTDNVDFSRLPGRQVRVDWDISEAISELKVSFGMTKNNLFLLIRRHLERNPFKKARRKTKFINTLLDFIEKNVHGDDNNGHESRSISLDQVCNKWANESDVFHVKVFKQFVKPYFNKHPGIKEAALDLILAHEQKIDNFNGMAKLIDLKQCIMDAKPHLSECRYLTLVLSEAWVESILTTLYKLLYKVFGVHESIIFLTEVRPGSVIVEFRFRADLLPVLEECVRRNIDILKENNVVKLFIDEMVLFENFDLAPTNLNQNIIQEEADLCDNDDGYLHNIDRDSEGSSIGNLNELSAHFSSSTFGTVPNIRQVQNKESDESTRSPDMSLSSSSMSSKVQEEVSRSPSPPFPSSFADQPCVMPYTREAVMGRHMSTADHGFVQPSTCELSQSPAHSSKHSSECEGESRSGYHKSDNEALLKEFRKILLSERQVFQDQIQQLMTNQEEQLEQLKMSQENQIQYLMMKQEEQMQHFIASQEEQIYLIRDLKEKVQFLKDDALQKQNQIAALLNRSKDLETEKSKICPICLVPFDTEEMLRIPNCHHIICTECFVNHFNEVIRNQNVTQFVCPICGKPDIPLRNLTPKIHDYFIELSHMIKTYIDHTSVDTSSYDPYDLFQKKLAEFYLYNAPTVKLIWCQSCHEPFIKKNMKCFKTQCPNCHEYMCPHCTNIMDEDMSQCLNQQCKINAMAESEQRKHAALDDYIKETHIECPNCKEKFSLDPHGCDHMKCTRCGYEFCRSCKARYLHGSECKDYESCEFKGLHAHHPRNCVYYLRDISIDRLEELLIQNNEFYGWKDPDMEDHPSGRCFWGRDDIQCERANDGCYGPICRFHYKDYLIDRIRKEGLDPVEILDKDELKNVFEREFGQEDEAEPTSKWLPQSRDKLAKDIQSFLPLERPEDDKKSAPHEDKNKCVLM